MYASEYVQLQDLFTSSELERLMHRNERYESVRLKNQVTIRLLIYQGFKITKMTHLRVQDEDLEAGSIYVRSMIRHFQDIKLTNPEGPVFFTIISTG